MEFHFRLRFLKRQFDLLKYRISPSHYLIKRYEKEGFSGLSYLPHGFPPVPKADLKPSKKLRIGYMGNINHPKGLSIVMEELYTLLLEGNVKLIIYGQPYDLEYFNNIKRKIKQLPYDAAKFCGGYNNTFEELRTILSSFDVLIFPSVWEENSPIVVREAFVSGKPVVASYLGGVPEIVIDEVNGLLFDPFNKGDLENKMKRLLNEPELLTRLVKGANNTIVDSMEEHAGKLKRLYADILGSEGNPGTR